MSGPSPRSRPAPRRSCADSARPAMARADGHDRPMPLRHLPRDRRRGPPHSQLVYAEPVASREAAGAIAPAAVAAVPTAGAVDDATIAQAEGYAVAYRWSISSRLGSDVDAPRTRAQAAPAAQAQRRASRIGRPCAHATASAPV